MLEVSIHRIVKACHLEYNKPGKPRRSRPDLIWLKNKLFVIKQRSWNRSDLCGSQMR